MVHVRTHTDLRLEAVHCATNQPTLLFCSSRMRSQDEDEEAEEGNKRRRRRCRCKTDHNYFHGQQYGSLSLMILAVLGCGSFARPSTPSSSIACTPFLPSSCFSPILARMASCSRSLVQLFYTSDLEEEQQMEEGVRSACSCVMSLSLSWQVLMGALPADVGGGERLMNRPKTNNGSMARQILRPQTTDQPTNLTNHLRTYPPTSIHKQPTFPPLANIEPPQCERSALSPPLPLPSVRSSGEEGDKHGTHTSTQREGPCLLLASAMAASLVREYRDMLCLGIFQCGTPATDERERERRLKEVEDLLMVQ